MRLAAAAQERGHAVLLTREPGGTAAGERIRELLLEASGTTLRGETEAMLFAASRAQLIGEVIQPALDRGDVVIVDRFVDSSLAYQGGGRGLDRQELRNVQTFATGGLEADLKILLDVAPEVALRRRHLRSESTNRLDGEERPFYERVRQAYLSLARENPARWCIVPAGAEPDVVWAQVWDAVASLLEERQPSSDARRPQTANSS